MTKSFTTKRTGFSRKPTLVPVELVQCSTCGVRMRPCDVEGHRGRNPAHVVPSSP